LRYQKGASLNVILSSDGSNSSIEDKGVIPGKVFELLGLKAQILPIAPKSSAVQNLMFDVGVTCFDHNQTGEIAGFIIDCMNGNRMSIINEEKYSWEELSKYFVEIFSDLVPITSPEKI